MCSIISYRMCREYAREDHDVLYLKKSCALLLYQTNYPVQYLPMKHIVTLHVNPKIKKCCAVVNYISADYVVSNSGISTSPARHHDIL